MWLRAAAATAFIALSAAPAFAFQIDTATTSRCHEEITLDALARAGWPDGREPPPLDETGQRIADDLAFELPADDRDLWTIALLIGVRHNDVGSADPFDLPALSQLHADPEGQREHCLREAQHDGERGDQQALAACRDFVLEEIGLALAEGDGAQVDMDAVVSVETHLLFRGQIDLDLPAYPFHVGRALHALQDSFSHAFRDPATERVRHVLNYVEGNLEDGSQQARDGHPHLAELDECGSGAGDERRRAWAVDASVDLLAALASGEGGRRGREQRAAVAFDAHSERQTGCTEANEWCDAREPTYAAGCSSGGLPLGGPGWPLAALGLAALARATLQRARRGRRMVALAIAAALLTPAAAGAQPDGTAPRTGDGAVPRTGEEAAPRTSQAEEGADETEPETEREAERQDDESLEREERVIEHLPDPVSETWGAALNIGAAIDRGAGAVALGARWNPSRTLGFGLDAEYNPWVSVSGSEFAAGAASLYAPVILRLKRFGTWELRTTAYAGATMILFDLVGVDRGTVGLFAGINPLGLALPLGAHAKLVIKPGDFVISAPQLRGIPYYYHQYRFTIGVEWFP